MSDTHTTPAAERRGSGSGAALAAGLVGAGLLAARAARAATPAPVTLYFTNAPAGVTGAVQIPGSGDTKVLNYALAAETLEAELYRQAVLRLTTGGTNQFGSAFTGLGLAATEPDVKYLSEFAAVEAEHRDFLAGLLGGNYVTAAGLKFDFGIAGLDRAGVVKLVYAAELTGVSAYLGGAGPGGLAPGTSTLAIAASILGTEARHTAAVAAILNGPPFSTSPPIETAPLATENGGKDVALSPDQILNGSGNFSSAQVPGGTIAPVSGPKGFVFM